ncbi:MAG TPA: heparinase II/III family protein [Gemmatimonadales bacterium]|nr:heparinase II/III family protein [Gemmatimonadales bacterium]
MVTAEELAARRAAIAGATDLKALLARLTERATPLLERLPDVPAAKALLSSDGGVCPDDGAELTFDPWSPTAHRCPRCGRTFTGERHDRHWARYQHLWLAERAAHLATLGALDDDAAAAARAAELLRAYAGRYWQYPNRDNVLGPSRLFFSTYLESIWITNLLAAAVLLRSAGRLDDATAKGVSQVADEAANLIGDFDEGFSNRQTWNDAALTAIAVWFEDEDLAKGAIEGSTGLLEHLLRGFGRDGMWYEGENYHLFALRGLLIGAAWARQAGVDMFAEPQLAARLSAALLVPAYSALPDFTFPARKDSRFGVSLAQPIFLELWEIGLAKLVEQANEGGPALLASWLAALYRASAAQDQLFESYLHDAPMEPRSAPRFPSRQVLSWWALLFMSPELSADPAPWSPGSRLLESQGLAILRSPERYTSLECGPYGGGHGHPDRLHLTLHAYGVHWLADPGTGSYVARDLSWYRSTLAHNAPRLDRTSQPRGDASCEAFDAPGEWAWSRGRYGEVTRSVVSGPAYVLDVVELAGRGDHVLELPWHFRGAAEDGRGRWSATELADEFVSRVERLTPDEPGAVPVVLELADGPHTLRVSLSFDGELLRAEGPGRPGGAPRETFYIVRATGRAARYVTVLEPVSETATVRGVRVQGGVIEVQTVDGIHRHAATPGGWEITMGTGGARVRLAGGRAPEPPFEPLLELDKPAPATGAALRVSAPPPLDGSLEGFDTSEPMRLELEDQYRRSEEPYPGPDEFSAVAHAAWSDDAVYLAVDVTKPELCFRSGSAPPLRLDNEPDDIHSDGLQVYLGDPEGGGVAGYLVVPDGTQKGSVRVTGAGESPGLPGDVRGGWRRTVRGYCVTIGIAWPEWQRAHVGGQLRFDLLVNEMVPGRERRSGQLVWSGGNGWVWLRGDRQDAERLGVLELVG